MEETISVGTATVIIILTLLPLHLMTYHIGKAEGRRQSRKENG